MTDPNRVSARPPTLESMFSLAGRVALVTGSSSGLGRAMAFAFAGAGAHVLINGRDEARSAAVAAEITQCGLAASTLVFDVADDKARIDAFAKIANRHGRLDVLVNNVGMRLRVKLDEINTDSFSELMAVDLIAPFALTMLAVPLMRRNRYGRIIMVSSTAAKLARAGDTAYTTAKGGIEALTRAFACEFGAEGITCNAIAPGPFVTEPNLANFNNPQMRARIAERTPVKRWGDPWEVGGAALFLASPAASYVNGDIMAIDGGLGIMSM